MSAVIACMHLKHNSCRMWLTPHPSVICEELLGHGRQSLTGRLATHSSNTAWLRYRYGIARSSPVRNSVATYLEGRGSVEKSYVDTRPVGRAAFRASTPQPAGLRPSARNEIHTQIVAPPGGGVREGSFPPMGGRPKIM